VGPLIDDISLARVTKYVNEAVADKSCQVLVDGRHWTADKKNGYWFGPTIILHTNATDPAMTDEIFGPVLSIIKVKHGKWPDVALCAVLCTVRCTVLGTACCNVRSVLHSSPHYCAFPKSAYTQPSTLAYS
jgi:hypothetical protein